LFLSCWRVRPRATTAVQISLEVELGWLKTLDKTVPGRAL
jgi:hypothetical protein